MNNEAQTILNANKYCTLATVCEDGSPWSTPLYYVHDEQMNLYWWSSVKSVHSKNIERDPRVFITIFDSHIQEGDHQGLYLQGTASQISDEEFEKVMKLFGDKSNVFILNHHNSTGKAPTRVYKAVFTKCWMNDEGEENGHYFDTRREIT